MEMMGKLGRVRVEMMGTLRAILPDGTIVTRFRTEKTAGLLACLAMERGAVARETLIERFWSPDDSADDSADDTTEMEERKRQKAAQHSLRTALSALRTALGADCFQAKGAGPVALRPGRFVTDVEEFEAALKAAKRAQTSEERERWLETATSLARGPFLEGMADTPDRWISSRRFQFTVQRVGALLDLCKLFEERGDDRNAFDAALQAHAVDPESDAAREAILRLSARTGEASVSAFDEEATLGEMAAALTVRSPTRSEARHVREALEITLSELTPATRTIFAHLGVFPQSFAAEMAAGVADAAAGDLTRLTSRHLLQHENAEERRTSATRRWSVPPVLRPLAWETLRSEERARTQEKFARFFLSLLQRNLSPERTSAQIKAFADDEGPNIVEAMHWLLRRPDDLAFAPTIAALWDRLSQQEREWDEWLRRHDWGSVPARLPPETPDETFCYAWAVLAHFSLQNQEYEEARARLPEAFRRTQRLPEDELLRLLWEMVNLAHHGQADALFTEISVYAEALAQGAGGAFYRGAINWLWAENLLARRDTAEAFRRNRAAVLSLRQGGEPFRLGQALRQQGEILLLMKRPAEAVKVWEETLQLFDAGDHWHGMAECLEGLARLRAASGELMQATLHIRQAIELFEKDGDRAAAVCAGGTLADILLERGDHAEALRLTDEGLAFWRDANHARWIRNFEERLVRLHERSPDEPDISGK